MTHPLRANYGGILQNYALQCLLKDLGHDPETISWSKYSWSQYFKYLLCYIRAKLFFKKINLPLSPISIPNNQKGLRIFIDKKIKKTKRVYFKQLKPFIKRKKYDALIVGSDQVWRPDFIENIQMMFLDFAKDLDIKKIAYGASFGTDEWRFNEKQTSDCSALIKQFCAIGVREDTAISLCKEHLNSDNVRLVLDPTLLIDRKEYDRVCEGIPTNRDKYLLAYILDGNSEIFKKIKSLASKLKLNLKYISAHDNLKEEDTVEQWLAYFRDADYIVTDSFHGTIFSIIFRHQFKTIINSQRGETRLKSLSNLLRINEQITTADKIDSEIPSSPAWEEITQRLQNLQIQSIDFISKALNQT